MVSEIATSRTEVKAATRAQTLDRYGRTERLGTCVERVVMPGSPAPTHDLIRLREPIALTVDAPVPSWVEPVLRRAPWVVVRRGRP
jgi:hypothetical protein